ncbi:40S ribosomal protein S19, partial [Candidatus Woesearchaeota archaeon]|nr:40S ribosomal protein S19 [Candidatus Woesearchaeota archaeon]
KILQQLETSGLIKKADKGVHKGRVLTAKGTSFLDKIAVQMAKQAHQLNKIKN